MTSVTPHPTLATTAELFAWAPNARWLAADYSHWTVRKHNSYGDGAPVYVLERHVGHYRYYTNDRAFLSEALYHTLWAALPVDPRYSWVRRSVRLVTLLKAVDPVALKALKGRMAQAKKHAAILAAMNAQCSHLDQVLSEMTTLTKTLMSGALNGHATNTATATLDYLQGQRQHLTAEHGAAVVLRDSFVKGMAK